MTSIICANCQETQKSHMVLFINPTLEVDLLLCSDCKGLIPPAFQEAVTRACLRLEKAWLEKPPPPPKEEPRCDVPWFCNKGPDEGSRYCRDHRCAKEGCDGHRHLSFHICAKHCETAR